MQKEDLWLIFMAVAMPYTFVGLAAKHSTDTANKIAVDAFAQCVDEEKSHLRAEEFFERFGDILNKCGRTSK